MVLLTPIIVSKAYSNSMLISRMNILSALVPIYFSTVYISFHLYNMQEIRVKYKPHHSINVTGKDIKSLWLVETNDDDIRP